MTISPNTKKIIYISIAILPIIIIGMLGKPLTKKNSDTTKIINPNSNSDSNNFTYKPNNDTTTKKQEVSITLNNASVNIEEKPQIIYRVINPLVTENLIETLISNLNFYNKDKINGTPEGDHLWINEKGSLFLSINQNQIVYTNSSNYQETPNSNLSKEEIVSEATKQLQILLGSQAMETINTNPKIEFLYIDPKSIEVEPQKTEFDKANIIAVSFNQTINNLPVITDSPNTEIIRVAINKNKKLADLRVYGGFLSTKEIMNSKSPILDKIDNTKLHRVSYAKDISSEKLFSDAKSMSITAEEITSAYYYQNNGFLSPVILLRGKMSTGRNIEPATFIYPIEPSSESL